VEIGFTNNMLFLPISVPIVKH